MTYIIFIFLNVCSLTHDVPIALFHLEESANGVNLDISFDISDFERSTTQKKTKITKDWMQQYLNDHMSVEFNRKKTAFIIKTISFNREHIEVEGTFEIPPTKKIKTVKIENTCLIDIKNQSNIIHLDINDASRDFRIHKDRTKIGVNYN